jgi:hypothetical protein
MSDFTYEAPDPKALLHTMRKVLTAQGHDDISTLLIGAEAELWTTSDFSGQRWNAYRATLQVRVRADVLAQFTDVVKVRIESVADGLIPEIAGYDLMGISVTAFLESPPDEDDPMPGPTWKPERLIKHDDLHFRSKTETKIYDALKGRDVLFFANATAVLGGASSVKREPDFLICKNGKWGILEVMGEQYHPAATAMKDHDRARLFKNYGISLIEFYDAARCYKDPNEVVSDFLARLDKS